MTATATHAAQPDTVLSFRLAHVLTRPLGANIGDHPSPAREAHLDRIERAA